jgi:serine/threonine protein kinase/tetratricopeptide (TPR) repeat protein
VSSSFGRYRLLERLGQGGMAEVFKAKSYGVEGFEKILVIKRILPELARSPEFVEMFIHEAKLAVRLSHANIVQVFDLGKAAASEGSGAGSPDAYYMAMEYVHGLDLATVLGRSRRLQAPLPVQLGVYVASEVAKGLDHAHRRRDDRMRPLGIVHRDISPQNVLLSFEGEVKVTDFGIAKARGLLDTADDEEAPSEALHGKFGYMSPEQAQGESIDARSDLFSLGTVLYECVAGVNPFNAPTTFETLRRVRACEYPPIELLRPDAPSELAAIVRTAMAADPAERYADAGSMYEALLAFLYAQGSRFGANDLAEFLARFRDPTESGPAPPRRPLLEADAVQPSTERTPVEIPASRNASSVRVSTSARYVAIDRAVEMGERREVTGLVLELPRDAEPSVFAKASNILERWGGRVMRKEAGHIAALFGLGDPDGRDTEMATRCALVALRSLDASRPPSAGLHIGRIHVSRSGEPTEDERLETLLATARDLARVREGQVAMSTQGMRQVRAFFEFEPMTDNDQPTSNVSAVLVKDVRLPGEAFGRFVGRKEELRRIGEVLASATRRTARVLTLRGDHGVGKTRLLYEVERRIRKGGYNVGFHVAACPPQGREFSLSAIVSMLQVLCGTAEGDANDSILTVVPRLRALGLPADEVNAVLTVLGATVPSPPGNANARLRQAFARMVQSLCEDRPHTFAWDVAHAMDEESFAVLDEVLRRLRQSRLVFAFAARTGFSNPLATSTEHVGIDLTDLAPPEVERLIGLRLGVEIVPEDLLRFVLARAGGHPLFVEEVIKALVEAGAITVVERHIAAMSLAGQDLVLPKTLRGLVASRMARLGGAERTTLQAAAILGDPIDVNVLSNMLGEPMPSLERSIAALKQRDFMVDRGPSELRFASPLVPEIVADSLTPEAAREMHAAAGQALETTMGARPGENAARIASHLCEAGERERAAGYYAKSGARRLETRQLEAAARDYARAIALADPSRRSAEDLAAWLFGLAAAVRVVRVLPDATELCQRVTARVDQGEPDGPSLREVRVRTHVAAAHVFTAVQLVHEARRRLDHAADVAGSEAELLGRVLVAGVELALSQGDYRRASTLLTDLRILVPEAVDAQDGHNVALLSARAFAGRGERATALDQLKRAEHLLPDDRMAAVERTKVRAIVDHLTHDFRSAALQGEMAIDMAREVGLTHEVLSNLLHLGEVLVDSGESARAYGAIRQALELSEDGGHERFANYARMLLAFLDGLQGMGDADKLLAQGLGYAESQGFTSEVVAGRLLLARLLHRRGRVEPAIAEYEKARVAAGRAGHQLVVDECEHALSELHGESVTVTP